MKKEWKYVLSNCALCSAFTSVLSLSFEAVIAAVSSLCDLRKRR